MTDEVKGETPTTQVTEPVTAELPKAEPAEEFDKTRAMALIEKLRAESRELSKFRKRAEELEATEAKRKEAELTELQKVQKRAEEAEARLKAAERRMLCDEIARKLGLPPQLAGRLQGETPEEIEADAKQLLEVIPKKTAPSLNPTNPGGPTGGESDAERRRRLGI